MMKYESNQIRNVGLMGHGGSGKTTLADGMLYAGGQTDRFGKVSDGTSAMDWEPEEIKKKISISTSFNYLPWNKAKINIIDTPGDLNFFADSRMSIQCMDTVLLVIDAVDGTRVQTERSMELASELKIPLAIFCNKMDKERANFDGCIKDIKENLSDLKPLIVQLPIGSEANFKGIINLLTMKAHIYKDDKSNFSKEEIPANLKDFADEYREKLVEMVAETNDELIEKYLSEGQLSEVEILQGFSIGIKNRAFSPVFFGAALTNTGTKDLLNMIEEYFPSPLDRKKIVGKDPSGAEKMIELNANAPFSGLIFKTIVDQFVGKLNIARIFSGSITSDQTLYISTIDAKEKISNMLQIVGKKQEPMQEAKAGDIVAFAKLKELSTGHTICSEKDKIIFDALKPLSILISYAVKPKTKGDEDKMSTAINRILEEDSSITVTRDENTSDLILSGMGQVHLDVLREKIKRKFNVEIALETPKVPYKETCKGKIRIQGKYKRQSGGKGQYGDCWLEIEPQEKGKGFEFLDRIVGGAIPKQYIPAIEKGIVDAMKNGVIAGYQVIDIKISVVDGSYHDVDSSEMAFKIAGSMGFKKGFVQAKPILLEPIMNMEIIIPEENMGDVMGDINSRRGRVSGMDSKGKKQIIKAQVPYAEVLTYVNDLTSITSGKGSYTMSYSHNEEVPAQIAEKIIEKFSASKEEEE